MDSHGISVNQSQDLEQDGRRHFVGFQPHFHLHMTSQAKSCKIMKNESANFVGC